MSQGICARCGALGAVELDHPDGRQSGKPLLPAVVIPLCRPCHLAKGRWDRGAGVEGGPATVRRVLARRASGLVFFAHGPNAAHFVTWPTFAVRDFAGVLEICAGLVPPEIEWDATWRP